MNTSGWALDDPGLFDNKTTNYGFCKRRSFFEENGKIVTKDYFLKAKLLHPLCYTKCVQVQKRLISKRLYCRLDNNSLRNEYPLNLNTFLQEFPFHLESNSALKLNLLVQNSSSFNQKMIRKNTHLILQNASCL